MLSPTEKQRETFYFCNFYIFPILIMFSSSIPVFLLFFLETESYYVVLTGLELGMQTKLSSNSWRFTCLCLHSATMPGSLSVFQLLSELPQKVGKYNQILLLLEYLPVCMYVSCACPVPEEGRSRHQMP